MTMRTEVTFFNNKSAEYRAEYDRTTGDGHSFRARREKVLAMIPEGTGEVLDLASGPGVMVDGLLKKGYRVTCADAAPEMIERAKDEHAGKEGVSFMVGDAYKLDVPDQRYDIVTAMGLIEYLEHEDTFLTETHRIVKDGGIFIITYPNYSAPWRVWNRLALSILRLLRNKKGSGVTHREYTKRGAIEQLRANGFETVDAEYYNFRLIPYPLDRIFPGITVWQSRMLECLGRSVLGFIGTGFILKAKKIPR